jgi:hypothetical protein
MMKSDLELELRMLGIGFRLRNQIEQTKKEEDTTDQ